MTILRRHPRTVLALAGCGATMIGTAFVKALIGVIPW